MIPVAALALGACKKKEEVKSADMPVQVAEPGEVVVSAPEEKAAALSVEERAAKLGFVKHLPMETEAVMSFHNGSKTAERLKASKLWKLVESEMGMGMDVEDEAGFEEMEEDFEMPEGEQDATVEEAPGDAEPMGPAALFGTEFTIAMGKSTGVQTANLLTLNRRVSYFQMRSFAKALVEAAKTGDFSGVSASYADYGVELAKDLISDPESGVGLFEKMNMPPMTIAFRVSSSGRDAAAQQLAALIENLAMFGEMVEPMEVERNGQAFLGQKISGAKISESMAESRGEMDEMLDAATVDRILAAVAAKDLVVASGTVGEYAVLFIGSSLDELQFAPDVAGSLAASDAMAFCDAYAAKELAAVIHGKKEMLDEMLASVGGLSDMAAGLRDGLSGSDGLGDTRDLETLLRMVGEREAGLRKLAGNEALGMVAFFEDGLKIESYGGTDNGIVDWKTPNRLASLGDGEDVVMFANMTTDAVYDEKARAYLETLMETGYALAMKVSEVPVESEDMAEFKEMAKMFDTRFRPDVVAVWDALCGDFGDSLGNESAWVMDLKGSVPAIPGIPQAVADEAKFPRLTMIASVEDRAKLASSWDKMNASLTSIMAKAGEMSGKELPMQKPVSSERNGYTTWFFALPFFNDEFMPSVTVGDQWFAASTSKNQALDLIDKAAAGGESRTGLWFRFNFKELGKVSLETVELLAKQAEALDLSESDLEDLRLVIEAMDDLDSLSVHARRENGALRSSVHLKTR